LEQKQVQIEENHAQALLDVEDQYQKKIMIEVARYVVKPTYSLIHCHDLKNINPHNYHFPSFQK
jgi:hypothetical protein